MSGIAKRKRNYAGLCLAGAAFCLWYLCYLWVQAAAEDGGKGVHLEWKEPAVSWQELNEAKENEPMGSSLFFYLWGQQEETVRNPETGQEARVRLITGSGDLQRTLPVLLVSGSCLLEKEGCLVSQSVAEALWGCLEVAGQSLEAGERHLIVRGVTKEREARVYCQPESEKWEQEKQWNLECYTAPEAAAAETAHTQKALAESFLARHGVSAPETSTDYAWQAGFRLTGIRLAGFLLGALLLIRYVLPCFFSLGRGQEKGLPEERLKNRWGRMINKIVIWVIILLALWYSLSWVFQDFTIPEDLIPPAWSDFGFWGEKWKEYFSRIFCSPENA